jgi:hypothetical protein
MMEFVITRERVAIYDTIKIFDAMCTVIVQIDYDTDAVKYFDEKNDVLIKLINLIV